MDTQGQPITLWRAHNNDPAEPVGTGQLTLRTMQGITFPSLEFNDIPADLVAEQTARFTFFTTLDGNVWVHAADARTFYPEPVVPTGVNSDASPIQVDTRIQIVWPHDDQGQLVPVGLARWVNIAVDLFVHGTLLSVPLDYQPPGPLTLYVAIGNNPLVTTLLPYRGQPIGQHLVRTSYTSGGQTFPRWVFNDVPASPNLPDHYLVLVGGVRTYPSIWTHATDPRTVLPNPTVPPACIP